MRVEIIAPTIELAPGLRDWVERRVGFVLGRFADRLRRVRITLSDVNGPRGGLDKECCVTAHVVWGEPLVAEVLDCDPAAAVSRAVERIAGQLSRGWERKRDRRKRVRSGGAQGNGAAGQPDENKEGGLG